MDTKPQTHQTPRDYAFFLSFSSFIGTFFFFGIFMDFYRTLWLSLLIGGALVWLVLTIAAPKKHWLPPRLLALLAITYGGLSLWAFFVFCQRYLFSNHGFWFFPLCFILVTAYGSHLGIAALERTSKFSSVSIMILLVLTTLSMIQKIFTQKDFLLEISTSLLQLDIHSFFKETALVTLFLLCQALILTAFCDFRSPESPVNMFHSIRRALVSSILFSSALQLLGVLSLGPHAYEYLTYPIYDMLSLPGAAEYLDRTEFLMLVIFLFCESVKTIVFFLAGRHLFAGQTHKKIHTA